MLKILLITYLSLIITALQGINKKKLNMPHTWKRNENQEHNYKNSIIVKKRLLGHKLSM